MGTQIWTKGLHPKVNAFLGIDCRLCESIIGLPSSHRISKLNDLPHTVCSMRFSTQGIERKVDLPWEGRKLLLKQIDIVCYCTVIYHACTVQPERNNSAVVNLPNGKARQYFDYH